METKEKKFSGFKMNGFLCLFIHLVVLPTLIYCGAVTCTPTAVFGRFALSCLAGYVCRIYTVGA